MFVDSPEQRRMRVKDSYELALQDWLGTAGFDRPEDEWPRRWAEAYVGFCAGEKRAWLHEQGMRWLPNPGWPERGGYLADGHGNSVPRFHITWGTGPGRGRAVRAPRARGGRRAGCVELRFRHRVDELRHHRRRGHRRRRHGARAERRRARPGAATASAAGEFALSAQAVIVTTGGIGGNHELVRREVAASGSAAARADALRRARARRRADARDRARRPARNEINGDRMWHYVEGIRNWDPIWPMHAIRIIPGPSSLWFDAHGAPAARPALPRLRHARHARAHPATTGHDHTLVRPHAEDHREGVRALGLRAEPRHDLQERARGARGAARQRPAVARAGVHGPRRGLHRRALAARARAADERARRRGPDRPRRARGPDRRPRPPDRQPVRQGRPDHRDPRRPRLLRRQGHAGRRAAPDPRPRRRPADRRAPARSSPASRSAVCRRTSTRACSRASGEPLAGPLRGRRGGRASAAAACTATARWRGRSSAAACSPGGSPAAPPRPPPPRPLTEHPSNGVLTPVCISDRGGYWTPCRTSSRCSGTRSRAGSSPGPRSSSWACSSSSSGGR